MSAFGNSFVKGLDAGERAYFDIQDELRKREESERAKTRFEWDKENRARADKQYNDTSAALDDYTQLSTQGLVKQNTTGFSDPSAMMLYSQGGQALVDDLAGSSNRENARMGLTPSYQTSAPGSPTLLTRDASPIELNRAAFRLAAANRDVNAMTKLNAEHGVLKGYEADRDYLTNLYSEKDPSKRAEILRPYAAMMSQFDGIKSSFTADPKTGSIVEHPYNGSESRQVDLIAATPYLLAIRRVLDQNGGDPMAAAQAVQKMSEDERKKIIDDAKRSLEQASKVGESINRALGTAETARHNRVDEAINQSKNAINKTLLSQNKTLSPEMTKRLNDLAAQIDAEADPAKRALLIDSYNRLYGLAATEMNKLVTPRAFQQQGPSDVQKIAMTEYFKALNSFDSPPSQAQIDALQDRFGVSQFFGGGPRLSWDATPGADAKIPKPGADAKIPSTGLRSAYAQKMWDLYNALEPSWRIPDTPTNQMRRDQIYQEYIRAVQDPNYQGQ